MTMFVLIVYTVNIAGIGIFVQRPYRSYFVNCTVTRILDEIVALAFLGFIVAGVLHAPTYFDEESINKLDSLPLILGGACKESRLAFLPSCFWACDLQRSRRGELTRTDIGNDYDRWVKRGQPLGRSRRSENF